MRLLLVGAPGVGKGTQAKRLSQDLGVPHVSTGDMFRDAIRHQTPLGKKAKIFIDIGSLVPDDLTIGLIEERFEESDVRKQGYILDGFPRTLPQARALDGLLAKLGKPLDAVVVSDDLRAAVDGLFTVTPLAFDARPMSSSPTSS